jgi:hypothetical protein
MFGYTISLVAIGGTVQWGTFTSADAAYAALGPDVSDTTSIELTRSRPPLSFTPAGLVEIGSIPVTILGGTPRVEFAHEAVSADPNGFGTGFATECGGTLRTGAPQVAIGSIQMAQQSPTCHRR